MKKTKDKRNSGFTLVELLVTVSIIVAFSGFMLPQLSKFRNQQTLQNSAQEMISAIRSAKNNALSGSKCGDEFKPTNKATYWYLTITTNGSYRIEPECSENNELKRAVPMTDYRMSRDVVIDKIYINTTECSGITNPQISFTNISGEVNFNNLGAGCRSLINQSARMVILLKSASTNTTHAVFVEKGGRIYSGEYP